MAITLDQSGSSAGLARATEGEVRKGDGVPLRARNWRVASLLGGWIAAMMIISILVIVLR
jgi:hypothetical protein